MLTGTTLRRCRAFELAGVHPGCLFYQIAFRHQGRRRVAQTTSPQRGPCMPTLPTDRQISVASTLLCS